MPKHRTYDALHREDVRRRDCRGSSSAVAVWLVVVIVSLLIGGPAWAQEQADPSKKERELNEQAVRAMIAEDYPKAIALLEESRSMGESNVVYLNLGRAYQLQGKCAKAREMLEKIATAPRVDDPSPEVVAKRAKRYLEELDETCEEAPPERANDDAKPTDEPGTDASVELDDEKTESTKADRTAPADTEVATARKNASTSGGPNLAGIAVLGTGVALGATAVVLELAATSQRNGIGGDDGNLANYTYPEAQDVQTRADRLSTVALGLGIAGAAATGVGIFVLTKKSSESQATVSLGATLSGPSISFRTNW